MIAMICDTGEVYDFIEERSPEFLKRIKAEIRQQDQIQSTRFKYTHYGVVLSCDPTHIRTINPEEYALIMFACLPDGTSTDLLAIWLVNFNDMTAKLQDISYRH